VDKEKYPVGFSSLPVSDGTDLGGHGRFLSLFSLASPSSSLPSSLAAVGAAADRFSVTEFAVDRWTTRRGPLGGVEDQLSSTFSGIWLTLRWIVSSGHLPCLMVNGEDHS
jgi:hypothetical protein